MIYLDNSATTIVKPPGVTEAMSAFSGNPGRGGHEISLNGARIIYECRERICELFGAPSPEQVIFVKNGTEALNLAILGLLTKSDHVVFTSMEHNSVVRPIVESGASYTVVKADKKGYVNPRHLTNAIRPNTKLFVVTHASNVCGSIQSLSDLVMLAHRQGVRVLVDAAQSAGVIPLNMSEVNMDFLAFSGHKGMMGPLGTGVLIIGKGQFLTPLTYGGTGSVSETLKQPNFLPDRYESGTLNGNGIAGLSASTAFILNEGIDAIEERKNDLIQTLIDGIKNIPQVVFYGADSAKRRADAVSFNIVGWDCNMLASYLEENYGIYGRSGLQCAPLAHKTIGSYSTGGTLRISPSYFTTKQEINAVLSAISKVAAE